MLLIDLRKVRTENLKFRADLRDRVINDWSVIQQMIVLSSKWLKIFIKASPVNAGFYMTTENHISFVTDLAANFGYNRFRIMPETVSKLLRLAT